MLALRPGCPSNCPLWEKQKTKQKKTYPTEALPCHDLMEEVMENSASVEDNVR